jgi:hypothetical protein
VTDGHRDRHGPAAQVCWRLVGPMVGSGLTELVQCSSAAAKADGGGRLSGEVGGERRVGHLTMAALLHARSGISSSACWAATISL